MTGAPAQHIAPLDATRVEAVITAVPDPEIPTVTIAQLGILRSVTPVPGADAVDVVITPTYSGCPAMSAIEQAVVHAAAAIGVTARVHLRLSPAWSTDWITVDGRRALAAAGIVPPGPAPSPGHRAAVLLTLGERRVACPGCGSLDTEEVARFGATACKALRRCRACREPFEEFKSL
ncbi:1,2-phenylacetyl-CoA epoxidase subunit PaaD [Janibacter sp. G1551]|uniref:1,2-phenylacetyl-CoA epoxidase subunit PaaD n=1 Tax=Janibacter sp. G1551 TaxID=3420440 RepID=UPI003D054126